MNVGFILCYVRQILSIPIYNQSRDGERLEDIIALCEAHGYTCSVNKKELIIETPAGRWIVNITKRPIFIEHQHTAGSVKGQSSLHWQPRMFLALHDVVSYIAKHDAELSRNGSAQDS